jgi:hypothetical protein
MGEIIIISVKNMSYAREAKFFLNEMKDYIVPKLYGEYSDDEHREWWLEFGDSILGYELSRKVLLRTCPELQNLVGEDNIDKVGIKELIDLQWELLINNNQRTEKILPGDEFIFIICQNSAGVWESIWTIKGSETSSIKGLCEFTIFLEEDFDMPA